MRQNPEAFRKSLEEIAQLYAGGDGAIYVNVSHRFSLEQAQEAFGVLINRGAIGKVLLCPSPTTPSTLRSNL